MNLPLSATAFFLQLGLLDFGATREYGSSFVNDYFKIIDGAVEGDRQAVLEYSRKVGFLTGYESQVSLHLMLERNQLHLYLLVT